MERKIAPLSMTNPYLADPVNRQVQFVGTVVSSTAIEGVHLKTGVFRAIPAASIVRKPRTSPLSDKSPR